MELRHLLCFAAVVDPLLLPVTKIARSRYTVFYRAMAATTKFNPLARRELVSH